MKSSTNIFIFLFALTILSSCQKGEVFPETKYQCSLSEPDETAAHPKAEIYQEIIDKYVAKGVLGVSVYMKDTNGKFLGVGGHADIASGVKIEPCNQFIIGSITKPITSMVTFSLVEDGVLSIDDFITEWLDASITDRLPNGKEIQIKHLLQHTSGLPDHYESPYYFDNLNKERNIQSQEDYLKYTYDKEPLFAVGTDFQYSNAGYVLIGMILEKASGKTMAQLYQEKIFDPLNLTSGYYGAGDAAIPDGLIKGYMDLNGNGEMVESKFFYEEELNTADGGIIMNPQDLGKLFEEWHKGNIISPQSVEAMKTWYLFTDFEEGDETLGYGYGIEKVKNKNGDALAHDGGVGGFGTFLQYYPETDQTFVIFLNSLPVKYVDVYGDMVDELYEEMFR